VETLVHSARLFKRRHKAWVPAGESRLKFDCDWKLDS
jgi:hypothetical protein